MNCTFQYTTFDTDQYSSTHASIYNTHKVFIDLKTTSIIAHVYILNHFFWVMIECYILPKSMKLDQTIIPEPHFMAQE